MKLDTINIYSIKEGDTVFVHDWLLVCGNRCVHTSPNRKYHAEAVNIKFGLNIKTNKIIKNIRLVVHPCQSLEGRVGDKDCHRKTWQIIKLTKKRKLLGQWETKSTVVSNIGIYVGMDENNLEMLQRFWDTWEMEQSKKVGWV